MSISYKTEVAFDGVVVVTDLFGRTMKMTNSEFAKGASALSFDVSDLANGIYLLTIQNNNETVISKKFTVAR